MIWKNWRRSIPNIRVPVTEEFYEVTPQCWNLLEVNRQLLTWERPTTPSAHTKHWAMPPRWSFCSAMTNPNPKSKSVTNHVDEYSLLTGVFRGIRLAALGFETN